MSGHPILAVEGVTFRFGERPAVANVSMELRPGSLLGLLGPNGSGKSTVLRLAAGLLRPDTGRVRLDGRDLATLGRAEIARRVAVVPQRALLPDGVTGSDVALSGRTPHLRPLRGTGALDEAIARRALALVDAEPFADRPVGELSGGERQRLVLARALAQEPDVLLLDEPTAHLDLPHQIAFLDLVRGFADAAGLAVLGAVHDLNLAAEYCDEIALMRGGHILVHGSPAEVLTPRWIEAVYDLVVRVLAHPQSGRPAILLPARRSVARGQDAGGHLANRAVPDGAAERDGVPAAVGPAPARGEGPFPLPPKEVTAR